MLATTFAAAGAATGVAEGLLRITGKEARTEVLSLVQGSPVTVSISPPAQHLRKPLLNLVVVGDQGCDTAALARAFAGEPQARQEASAGNNTQPADFLLLQAAVSGQPASVCLWHLGGRGEAQSLGPGFYSLASAFLAVYSSSQPCPAAALSYWAAQCCGPSQGLAPSSLPLVAVASCRPGDEDAEQAAVVTEAQKWCQQHGGVPHFIVRGLQDSHGIQAAFQALLQLALHHHEQAALTSAGRFGACSRDSQGQATEHAPPEALHSLLQQPDLPALMQNELGPALHHLAPERQLHLVRQAS